MAATPPPADNRLQAFPQGLPAVIRCAAGEFHFVRQFKHDFFAATGLYEAALPENEGGRRNEGDSPLFQEGQKKGTVPKLKEGTVPRRVVLKIQRVRPYFGVPLGWLGAWLTRHEAAIYRELADLPGVPGFVDFYGPTGFLHEFVPGSQLNRNEPVSDSFFDELAELLRAVHARRIAYVDLNKRQNILVDEDGKPHLIDFQISFRLGRRGGDLPQAVLEMFQQQDWYHFAKHKRRCRPDLMPPEEIERSRNPNEWITTHRFISRPYFLVRRWILRRLNLPIGDDAEG